MHEVEPATDTGSGEVLSIVVVRVGGMGGIRRQWRVGAASDQAPHWLRLIDECPWTDDPSESDAPQPDRFTWSIRARVPHTTLEKDLAEPQLTGPWAQLVEAVRASAR